MQPLVLGSSSQYRRELLERLQIPFTTLSPDVDETASQGADPGALAQHLAVQKAVSVRNLLLQRNGDSPQIVIASDQVAAWGHSQLHKPGTEDRAREQLHTMSGGEVTFHTALHMLDGRTDVTFSAIDTTVVTVRNLSDEEIERYIERDQPLDCAGSFKIESLGISLFESVNTEDPTALIGLPLIAVARGLRLFGLSVP